ncbi:MAG TPA: nucleoside-triphosphatase [Phycisphaerae bacterium]|nr:nucleoside-triphosphatase [Phycisphaerae bacterium]
MSSPRKNLLLTGPPGIGKTTVIVRLARLIAGRRIAGFHTEEILACGLRRGFRVTTLSGQTGVLAEVGVSSRYRVGRYGVHVAGFEALVLPELKRTADVILIDEIGKMECFSRPFVETVRHLLSGPTPVIATVAMKGAGFIAEVKELPNSELLHLTTQNREEFPQRLAEVLRSLLSS